MSGRNRRAGRRQGSRQGSKWMKRRVVVAPAQNDALAHAMAMVAAPTFLGFLGSLLDGELGTGPLFLIAFAAFGVVGAFASAYLRYEARIAAQDEGKPWARGQIRAGPTETLV